MSRYARIMYAHVVMIFAVFASSYWGLEGRIVWVAAAAIALNAVMLSHTHYAGRCRAVVTAGFDSDSRCVLRKGHAGSHVDDDGCRKKKITR